MAGEESRLEERREERGERERSLVLHKANRPTLYIYFYLVFGCAPTIYRSNKQTAESSRFCLFYPSKNIDITESVIYGP